MRQNGTPYYLHPDHLGSTVLSTTSRGTTDVAQGYHGYGKYCLGNVLPTDHRYTGQKLDLNTGLMYYNARYYDRHIGTFISPRPAGPRLVPDPTHVWDYNRFLYARGNPLKYNDPTGHCASYSSIGEEPKPKPGDGDCWGLVNHILGLWERDQSGYWQQRWVSQEIFRKHVAATLSNDSAFMLQEIDLYWNSETYGKWEQQQSKPTPTTSSGDLMCGGDPACQAVVGAANQVAETCQEIDCVAVGNDVVGVGSALLVLGSPLCGPAVLGCAAAGGTLGNVSITFGAVWTVYNYTKGEATNADLAVTLPLAMKAVTTRDPKVSATVAILQVIWDAFLSPDERW